MDELKVVFVPGPLGSNAQAVYDKHDAYLVYWPDQPDLAMEQKPIKRAGQLRWPALLIAGDLTFVFGATDARFVALDGYTRPMWWQVTPGARPPNAHEHGALYLRGLPDEMLHDELAVGLDVDMRYEVPEDLSWIRVVLVDAPGIVYYEVARNLLVGLSDGRIMDAYLLDLIVKE